jgi:hypothetical protein
MAATLDPEFRDDLVKKGIPVTLYLGATIPDRQSLGGSFEKSKQTTPFPLIDKDKIAAYL